MISPSLALPIYAQLWHLRAPLEREKWQKDGWLRYFRTQLLLLPQSANTGLHKDGGGLWGWEGGGTISSVTNLVFTPGQEGKVIQYPPPKHTHTHDIFLSPSCKHTHTHTISFWPRHANTHTYTHTICGKCTPSQSCTVFVCWVHGCVWNISAADFGAYVVTHPDPVIYRLSLFWPELRQHHFTLSSKIVQSPVAPARFYHVSEINYCTRKVNIHSQKLLHFPKEKTSIYYFLFLNMQK